MIQEKDRVDLLWKIYQEHYTRARHHETRRSNVIQYLLITGGLIGTLVAADGVKPGDWPLACFLILLGLFGGARIDATAFPGELTLWAIKDACDREREARHPWLTWFISVHWMWVVFPLLVSLLGCILLYVALH